MKLHGKTAIITGASQGLGKEIARQFMQEGASLSLCARNENELRHTVDELYSEKKEWQTVVGMKADVSTHKDVTSFIDFSVRSLRGIDCLINNAGVYGPMQTVEYVDLDEWESTFHINVMGVLMMSQGVIPYLKQRGGGRIINLSGGGATSPLPGISAYAATKAAVVRLTETLAMELEQDNIYVNAIAPGALNTRMLDEVLMDGKGKVPDEFYEKALKQKESGGTPLSKGAKLCVYLASGESDGITGKLLSAVWDDWKNLHNIMDKMNADIYTLRRIVPEDRTGLAT